MVLNLIKGILLSKFYDDAKLIDVFEDNRQGGVLSPLLCNIYLDKVDTKIRDWDNFYRGNCNFCLELNQDNEYYNL
jgi:retron-type reverse transcriptase